MLASLRARLATPLLSVALLTSLPFVAGCRKATVAEAEPQAVKVAAVERATGAAAIRYSAHIEPATRVEVAFKVGGYVDSIAKAPGVDGKPRLLQEGDPVRDGQEIASVRKNDYVQRLDEARAAYAQSQANAEQAQTDLGRADKLVKSGSLPEGELDAAKTKLAALTAAAQGAKARVDEAASAVSDATLRSPLAGVVLKRAVEVGTLAASGMVAFTLADVSTMKVIFAVPDNVLPRVQLGATQTVSTEAFPGVPFKGRISRISPSADPKSRVFEAEVSIPNGDGRLKTGMVAALSLDAVASAGDAKPGVPLPLVPLAAIVRAPNAKGFAVFVVEDDNGVTVAHARPVTLGDYLGKVIPVTSGLQGGERIVVLGAGLLSDGEAVEVVP